MAAKPGKIKQFFRKPAVRTPLRILLAVLKCLFTILLVGVITASIVGCVMIVYVVTNFDGSEGIPDLEMINLDETSIVYTRTSAGEWQEQLRLEGTNSIWADIEDIPLHMQNAVIAIEDERFREHYGVDWKRTISAFANLVLHFSSTEYGGSTITQQLIKVMTQEDDHKIERKITEIMRAIYMERNCGYSKDDILEAYLNVLPLSGNIEGVGAAANYYFGKDIQDLSLAQCAAIAGITQNPSRFNPYTHPENLRRRQETVLFKMHELGFITDDEYIQASNEELVFQNSARRVAVQDYYVDLLIEDIAADLMEQYGYSYSYAIRMVYYGGLRIYSHEQPELQAKVEAVYADDANFPTKIETDKQDPQGAIFIMDYEGHTVATAGGRGEKTANRVNNRSTTSVRQPGSAMKPIAVYAPAISNNLVHFSSLVPDAPITLPNGAKWPPNYGSSKPADRGLATVTYALQRSLNTVPAQLLNQLTPERSYTFLTENLQMTTLVSQDIDYAPLALGGLTYGVSCREMAAAYQVFGNGGYYHKPFTYERVTADGKTLLEDTYSPIRALDENSAYVMNRLLQRVVRGGTAGSISGSWGSGWEVYAKTGTTGGSSRDGEYNVYFAGGTPQYVAASWFGYDYDKSLSGRQTGYAMSLWNKAMLAIRDNALETKQFTLKGTTEEHTFCAKTGLLVGPENNCPSTLVGVYKPDNVPGNCTTHLKNPAAGDPADDTTGTAAAE